MFVLGRTKTAGAASPILTDAESPVRGHSFTTSKSKAMDMNQEKLAELDAEKIN